MADRTEYDDLDLTLLTVTELRDVYSFYRRAALYGVSKTELDKQLELIGPVTPIEWIDALKAVTAECERCDNGTYSWGASINGRMTHSGTCFRCDGKGYQTLDDFRRNRGYDNHAIRRAFA